MPRPALIANLAALSCARGHDVADRYALVVGKSGTGASTAVRNTVRSLPFPKSAIHFSAPELVASFSSDLARAVGCPLPCGLLTHENLQHAGR